MYIYIYTYIYISYIYISYIYMYINVTSVSLWGNIWAMILGGKVPFEKASGCVYCSIVLLIYNIYIYSSQNLKEIQDYPAKCKAFAYLAKTHGFLGSPKSLRTRSDHGHPALW